MKSWFQSIYYYPISFITISFAMLSYLPKLYSFTLSTFSFPKSISNISLEIFNYFHSVYNSLLINSHFPLWIVRRPLNINLIIRYNFTFLIFQNSGFIAFDGNYGLALYYYLWFTYFLLHNTSLFLLISCWLISFICLIPTELLIFLLMTIKSHLSLNILYFNINQFSVPN